jgi:RNA polymerase subunit RPABC4/transcription elongation factor Spt4
MTRKGTWIEKPHKMAGTALCCTACGWKNLLETRCCPNCGAEMETEDGLVVVFELNDDGTYTRKLHTLPDEVSEKTDDNDKLKYVAFKINLVEEKLNQLEKDIHRLEMGYNIFPIEPTQIYPRTTSTGICAYAGPEFGGCQF